MLKTTRIRKHIKVRKTVKGSTERPRLSVYRSHQHIFAQIIDDNKGVTLVWASDVKFKGPKKQKAYEVGKELAEKAKKVKITNVVFDRGGFLYEGRVAELAKGAREGGLNF